MRLERAGINQIKIFVTFDELAEHGLSKDEVGKDTKKWNHLLTKIIDRANDEFDLLLTDTVVVDIFLFQSQEIVFVVTLLESEDGLLDFESDILEGKLTNNPIEKDIILFEFNDIEDVIQYAFRTNEPLAESELYYLNHHYYLMISNENGKKSNLNYSLLFEYGNPSEFSIYYIREYGKKLVGENVTGLLMKYFSK